MKLLIEVKRSKSIARRLDKRFQPESQLSLIGYWNPEFRQHVTERAVLRAELDAAFFHLYGIEREDAEYILSTFTNSGVRDEIEEMRQSRLWERGGIGEQILAAYDRLGPLAGDLS